MSETVHLPIVGATKKTTAMIFGAGAVAVFGVALYRRKQAANAAASTATTDTSQIDPATGFAFGSTEDAQALAAQSSYVSPTDIPSSSSTPTVTPIVSNDQWAQNVEEYLINQGQDANAVGSAIGKYLTGQGVTPEQRDIIQQAIAIGQYPPQGGPNGYPPSIRDLASAPSAPATAVPLQAPQLFLASKTTKNLVLRWTPVENAEFYLVLGNHFPQFVGSATQATVPLHGGYHVRAYPHGYSHTTYARTDLNSPYLLSPASNTIKN